MTAPIAIDVAIIGGGFSGASVAYHLARQNTPASIVIFEPRDVIGGGLAYNDPDPAHRVNVPAKRMSLLPDDEDHFARWLRETGADLADTAIVGRDGALYPRRSTFGLYVASQIGPLLRDGRITRVKSAAVEIARENGRWRITAASGEVRIARHVVIATTHPAPEIPMPLAEIGNDPRVIRDSLAHGAISSIPRDARVVIVGTGLTMADVVASLDRNGHHGPITAFSRRGLRSRGHSANPGDPFGDFSSPPANGSELLAKVRRTIDEARGLGLTWHNVIDAVRAQAQTFWPKLSLDAKRRIVRHLRVYWDVHRFRIAPQVEDVLDRGHHEGNLDILAATLISATASPTHLSLKIRPRGQSDTQVLDADRVVVTTGPGHASIVSTQPHLATLAAAGRLRADALGLGIACNDRSEALDAKGRPQPTLLVAGPLARATFGELMGLPQVSMHTLRVAQQLAEAIESRQTVCASCGGG